MADTLFDGAALASFFEDDGEQRRRGHDATSNADGSLTALYYNVPATGVPEGVGSVAMMYVANDADVIVCEVDLQAAIPGASAGWTRVDADHFELAGIPTGPIDWPEGVRYRAWAATVGDGSPFGQVRVTDPGTFPVVSEPDGYLTCAGGLYGGGAVPPETIPGSYAAHWDVDFEFTADSGAIAATLQAVGPLSTAALTGGITNPGALAVTGQVPTASLTGGITNPGTMAAVGPGPSASITVGVSIPGVLAAVGPLSTFSGFDATQLPGIATPAGTTPTLTPGGSTPTLTPSGTSPALSPSGIP